MSERVQISITAPPFPAPVVLVTAAAEGKDGIITLAWVGTASSNPLTFGVGIRPSRYTYDLIMKSREFAINVPTAELLAKVDACGITSGRDIDKFKEFGLTRISGKATNAPLIAECPVSIECKLKETVDLGSHHLFLGEVVSTSADSSFLDGKGHLHLDKLDSLAYIGGKYRTLGAAMGTYGEEGKKLARK